jgi:hypothetical protein
MSNEAKMREVLRDVAQHAIREGNWTNSPTIEGIFERLLLPLLLAGQAMREENQKFLDWIERMAKHSEERLKDCPFITLKEAYLTDAKNFRATGKNKRAMNEAWDAALEKASKP